MRSGAISLRYRRLYRKVAKCTVDNLAKIDLWQLARTKGDYDEPCQILSCDQAARAVVVISYSDGCASVRNYCAGHEGKNVAKLKRINVGIELVDHRWVVGSGQR
jgi:hypothetical protein